MDNNYDYEHRLTMVEERSKSNEYRINDLERRQNDLDELVCTVKALAIKEENVESTVQEIKNDVKTLTSKSGRRWDDMIDKVVWLLVAAVIGFVLAKIGITS